MKAETYLKNYIQKTSSIVKRLFEKKEREFGKVSSIGKEMMEIYFNFMGGKNIRGSLTKLGYEIFGGKNEKAILEASLMVEIAHAFLLMHDDIMDQDALRRSLPTVHIQYEKIYRKIYKESNPEHFGLSMAIDLGDAGFALAYLLLGEADFSPEVKTRVLKRFSQQILTTAFGQALDVNYEQASKIGEADVMRIHHYKTANYTITGPLQYGALFAGAKEEEIKKIEKYGLQVGIAFQLRDDELGLYSDEKKLGKPIGSDIREGKITLLHLKALEFAKGTDKKVLQSAYGNKNLTLAQIKKVQEITIKTGALDYSQKLARRLVEKGKKFVPEITTDPELQDTLYKMADFMIERES
ncbi:MAG: polyprenyl synthetase family protein [Candidatus Portnoybacteria bacterium CG06_land_8_20_14_3_00_39_12]|uniref:Polyprenyl synthetase family protein n=1 Tax=Candidatus Portnoybacteria bacterium CG06_land_8_20_14_3_00_39_12 TaxID=1974809 RepID=A0A2M7AXY1_9BACT|nr:MAG: polyprenyl synthetase family protein [Candidatus Portnoybacteria bacterium CG06_land_8_20_14_3_00_39_12]